MQNDEAMSALFETIEGMARNNQSPTVGIGKVISTDPLVIRYNGMDLDEKELWINDYLWTNHSRTTKGETSGHIVSGTQPAGHHSHTHGINNDYTDTYNDTTITTDTDLKPGYYVAIMPMQDSTDRTKQQYIVLCHIMRLDRKYK